MINRSIIAKACLVLWVLALSSLAFAHGTDKHGKTLPADTQMKKLHAMMPMFSIESARLESAIEKGDAAAAEASAGRILQALPDLKKSKPHKHVKQRQEFVALATNLETALTNTLELAKKGDLIGANNAFKKMEAVCAACHARFRD